jgi:ribose 5-phosphate isomerase B
MKLAIGSDHAGFPLKAALVDYLHSRGYDLIDVGTGNADVAVDYPDFAEAVARKVLSGEAARGIVVCGSGVGASIAANKIPGIYAAVCHDTYSAHQGVEHDNMNVLCVGCRIVGQSVAQEIVAAFVNAHFEYDQPRHVRRHEKVVAIEQGGIGIKRLKGTLE